MASGTLDQRIREYCEAHNMNFMPWEAPPWEVDDGPCPPPNGTAYRASWPKAQQLRRQIIAALAADQGAQKGGAAK